ncbi:CTD phosphatase Fcp1 [Oleoguttula sp. CCFEE 5521]
MRLFTPANLRYPITVTRLRRKADDTLEQNQALFSYQYKLRVTEGSRDNPDGEELVERSFYSDFTSELEGTVSTLHIREGDVIIKSTLVADIEEACTHSTQYGGICVNCGKNMDEVNFNTSIRGTDRATVNTTHANTALLMSQDEAGRADEEARRRLLEARKLTLVVDLDQTVIQACVEKTLAVWKNDPSNPNYEALQEVRTFDLVQGNQLVPYYLKLRPGLEKFLREMSELYEMHIYTMATRDYALNVARIIDPDQKVFADRILSRDESGSMNAKFLKRLFPVNTKMVLVIDDRGDVWQWTPNLLKVKAYDFFVGIGDINSAFLPKRQELDAAPVLKPAKHHSSDESRQVAEDEKKVGDEAGAETKTNGTVSAVDHIVSMAGSQDQETMQEKMEQQSQDLESQIAESPLLQKQKILDAADSEAEDSPAASAAAELLAPNGDHKSDTPPQDAPKYRHNLLQDDETEQAYLATLGHRLREVHTAFFTSYDSALPAAETGRIAALRPDVSSRKPALPDLSAIPDAAHIMASLRHRVLSGVHLVFSGVVPLGVNIHNHDTVIWAKTFGATVSESVGKKTTHVIASPERRTAKVRQAAKRGGRVAIVSVQWLFQCFMHWRRVSEDAYRIHTDATANGTADLPNSFEGRGVLLSSSDESDVLTEPETETDTPANGTSTKPSSNLAIDTDWQELETHRPSLDRADSSPTLTEAPEDWGSIEDELNEFLGSDADDSETESVLSIRSADSPPSSGKKRKRGEGEADPDGDAAEVEGDEGSRLQKRKKEALVRTSSLTQVASASGATGESSRSPGVDPGGGEADGEEQLEGDDELEAALAAELDALDDE